MKQVTENLARLALLVGIDEQVADLTLRHRKRALSLHEAGRGGHRFSAEARWARAIEQNGNVAAGIVASHQQQLADVELAYTKQDSS